MTHPQTLIANHLEEKERTQSWLARKLRISRQTAGAWVRAEEACPRARQAQIVLFLNPENPVTTLKASDLFDRHGFARVQQEAPTMRTES